MSIIEVLGKDGNNIDTLDSSYIDPFTLETIETQIQEHSAVNKNLILARVQTLSTLNNKQYFYYSAGQLNKVIFRKLSNPGGAHFLFRLQTLNPLTNTEILGEIEYFVFQNKKNSKANAFLKTKATSNKKLNSSLNTVSDSIIKEELLKNSVGSELRVAEIYCENKTQKILKNEEKNLDSKLKNFRSKSLGILRSITEDSYQNITDEENNLLEKKNFQSTENIKDKSLLNRSSFNRAKSLSIYKLTLRAKSLESQSSKITLRGNLSETILKDSKTNPLPTPLTNLLTENLSKMGLNSGNIEKCGYFSFLGTENDYIQSGTFRKYFKKNALNLEDAKLFELPSESLKSEGINMPAEFTWNEDTNMPQLLNEIFENRINQENYSLIEILINPRLHYRLLDDSSTTKTLCDVVLGKALWKSVVLPSKFKSMQSLNILMPYRTKFLVSFKKSDGIPLPPPMPGSIKHWSYLNTFFEIVLPNIKETILHLNVTELGANFTEANLRDFSSCSSLQSIDLSGSCLLKEDALLEFFISINSNEQSNLSRIFLTGVTFTTGLRKKFLQLLKLKKK
ncbi:hypothetical protein HDU92_002924 [Lobulomyces angularis]|nr:hypothetical protein HDU92_002924 [Lobulomyces angularis]